MPTTPAPSAPLRYILIQFTDGENEDTHISVTTEGIKDDPATVSSLLTVVQESLNTHSS